MKKNTAIATNVQQSELLVKLGIDKQTADMLWIKNVDGLNLYPATNFSDASSILAMSTSYPAWSVEAILNLLPMTIDIANQPKFLRMTKWVNDELELSQFSVYYEDADGICYHEIEGNSLVECLVGMVKRLHF